MAVTLAQAAALEPSPLRRGTMQMFSQVSTVFDRLPLESINGAAYAYSKDKVLPGTAFRTVNEAYVESTGLVNQDTESLVILGGEAHVDTFIERTMDSTPELLLAGQTRMKVESLQATFVCSTVTPPWTPRVSTACVSVLWALRSSTLPPRPTLRASWTSWTSCSARSRAVSPMWCTRPRLLSPS